MTTTSTLYATATTSTGTWTNAANATGSTAATFAAWTSTTRSATATLELSGYNFFSQIPSNAVIGQVHAVVKQYETVAGSPIASVTAQLFSGTTAIGAAVTLTLSTTTTNSQTITFATAPTASQISNLSIRILATRANVTTSATVNIDYASMYVDYTVPQPLLSTWAGEDWSGGFSASHWTSDTVGANTITADGQLQVANASTTSYVHGVDHWNLDVPLYMKVVPSTAGTTYVALRDDTGFMVNQFRFVSTGVCQFGGGSDGSSDYLQTFNFTPGQPIWARIRWDTANTGYWYDTSPDGFTWTQQGTRIVTQFADPTNCFIEIGVTGGTATFDNINVTPPVLYDKAQFFFFMR